MKTMYAECDSCGELDDLTETWYYVGATNGPEEDTALLVRTMMKRLKICVMSYGQVRYEDN